MNSTLHQWKWDFRRIRTMWVLWILLLAGVTFGSGHVLGSTEPNSALGFFLGFARYIVIYLFGILLVARIMYTTPFTGTRVFWKTRPLKHSSLFWEKSLMITLLIFLPVLLVQVASWQAQNLGGRFLFWGALHFGALALALFLLAATWAALCKQVGTFFLGFCGTGAFLAVCAIIFNQLSERVAFFPLHLAGASVRTPTGEASTMLTMIFCFLVGAGAAWILGGRLRDHRAAVLALAVGIAVSAGANHLWRTDFLRVLDDKKLPKLTLDATVLDRDETLSDDQELLWNQIAVVLPANQVAHPQSWQNVLVQDGVERRQPTQNLAWSHWASRHQRRLASFYPRDTRFSSPDGNGFSCIESPGQRNALARIWGDALVTVYEWRPVASLPLDSEATVKRQDGGTMRIGSLRQNRLEIISLTVPAAFAGPHPEDDRWGGHDQALAFVVYHEKSQAAAVAGENGYSGRGGASFSVRRQTLNVELDDPKWRRLTKVGSLEQSREALRLDVYKAVPVGRAEIKWDRENWVPYLDRTVPSLEGPALPKPAIARIPFPENPTPDQVDAYLDGILFSLSDNMTGDDWKKAEEDLKAIGSAHLDRLLARMPVGSYAEHIVHRALRSLLTQDHKQAALEALTRDPGMISLVHQKGWDADARPVLSKLLHSHRRLDYASAPLAVTIVASQADPATYDDLRWHFTHSYDGLRDMAKALEQCPGFPLKKTLAEMWTRARYEGGSRRTQLAPLAARLGDKEALRQALIDYVIAGREHDLILLSEAVEHPGGDLLPAWLHSNFEALTFNEETRKFELK